MNIKSIIPIKTDVLLDYNETLALNPVHWDIGEYLSWKASAYFNMGLNYSLVNDSLAMLYFEKSNSIWQPAAQYYE